MLKVSHVFLIPVAIAVAFALIMLEVRVISDVWTWFILPTYHIELLKPVIAGIVLILSIVQMKGNMFDDKEQEQSLNIVITQFISLLLAWLTAYIIHLTI